MNIYKAFKTDEAAEREGVWVRISPTARLKIARAQNPRHTAAMQRLAVPYLKPGQRTTDLDDATYQSVAVEAAAETILVDWEGVLDRNDQPCSYSKEAAHEFLKIKDFFSVVWTAAQGFELYREARIQEQAKN